MSTGAGIGIGSSVVGGEMQGWAAVLARQAQARAFQNEINKQHQYASQAQGITNTAIGQSTPAAMQTGMQNAVNTRLGAYGNIGQVPLGLGPNSQSQYNPGVADAYTKMLGGLRAKNLGYSDWAVQQAIQNLNSQRQLDTISNFAGGQAQNVYPQQLYKAQHSWDDLAMAGQAVSSLGGAAGNYMQFAQQPQRTASPGIPMNSGGPGFSAWSGYGGIGNVPPQGTYYNPITGQNSNGPIRYW